MLRGLAIVIMAIDHVRDFFLVAAVQDPMANSDIPPGLFITRWITHFCAPVFVLLAGTSAGLMAGRKGPSELARFLFTRGAWLIFVEWFVIATAFTFAPGGLPELDGRVFVAMQVIWAIGASMVVLSAAQLLGRNLCLGVGVVILAGHNLLDAWWPASQLFDLGSPLWVALHAQMSFVAGPFQLFFAYPLLPWIGVMLLGFGIAEVFELPPGRRNVLLLNWGLALTVAFFVLRLLDVYGDPNHWEHHASGLTATLIDFFNTSKYPPSLSFLLMTLAPAAIFAAFADRMHGPVKDALVMFGRVPFAFYVAHFFLIHALSVLLGVTQGFSARQMCTIFFYYPKGYGVPLTGIYVVWIMVMVILYPFCRWVAAVKGRRRDWWLSYL